MRSLAGAWVPAAVVLGVLACAGGAPRPATTDAFELLEAPDHDVRRHAVAPGAEVLVIDETGDRAILGHHREPILAFLDLETGAVEEVPVPLVPRVALPLPLDEGAEPSWAVFGYGSGVTRAGFGFPTPLFLVVRGREVTPRRLQEPIVAGHGVAWGRDLVLGDRLSRSLVFVATDDVHAGATSQPIRSTSRLPRSSKEEIPLGRIVLADAPYRFVIVGERHAVVSYETLDHLEIVDLDLYERAGGVKLGSGSADRALLGWSGASSRFVALDTHKGMLNVFSVHSRPVTKSRSLNEPIRLQWGGARPTGLGDFRREAKDGIRTGVLHVTEDGSALAGVGGRMKLFREVGGEEATIREQELEVPLEWMERLVVFDEGRRVVISSPSEGAVFVASFEALLADR